jgi:hypothetical protein
MLGKCCTIAGWELKYLPLWYISENCSSNQLHSDLRTQLKSKNKRTCTCWCIVSWYLILSDFHYFLNKYRIYKDFSLDLYRWVSSLTCYWRFSWSVLQAITKSVASLWRIPKLFLTPLKKVLKSECPSLIFCVICLIIY